MAESHSNSTETLVFAANSDKSYLSFNFGDLANFSEFRWPVYNLPFRVNSRMDGAICAKRVPRFSYDLAGVQLRTLNQSKRTSWLLFELSEVGDLVVSENLVVPKKNCELNFRKSSPKKIIDLKNETKQFFEFDEHYKKQDFSDISEMFLSGKWPVKINRAFNRLNVRKEIKTKPGEIAPNSIKSIESLTIHLLKYSDPFLKDLFALPKTLWAVCHYLRLNKVVGENVKSSDICSSLLSLCDQNNPLKLQTFLTTTHKTFPDSPNIHPLCKCIGQLSDPKSLPCENLCCETLFNKIFWRNILLKNDFASYFTSSNNIIKQEFSRRQIDIENHIFECDRVAFVKREKEAENEDLRRKTSLALFGQLASDWDLFCRSD